jgi:hypothetical protein
MNTESIFHERNSGMREVVMNRYVGLILGLSILVIGCQKGGGSSSAPAVISAVSLLSISVANAASLPTCDNDRRGQYETEVDLLSGLFSNRRMTSNCECANWR